MGLYERCQNMYQQMLRAPSPVHDLMAFVVAETGRTADPSLSDSLPLCLYFPTVEDREEFIAAFQEAKPNVISKRLP